MESLRQLPKTELHKTQFLKQYFPEVYSDNRYSKVMLDEQSCKTSLDSSSILTFEFASFRNQTFHLYSKLKMQISLTLKTTDGTPIGDDVLLAPSNGISSIIRSIRMYKNGRLLYSQR